MLKDRFEKRTKEHHAARDVLECPITELCVRDKDLSPETWVESVLKRVLVLMGQKQQKKCKTKDNLHTN